MLAYLSPNNYNVTLIDKANKIQLCVGYPTEFEYSLRCWQIGLFRNLLLLFDKLGDGRCEPRQVQESHTHSNARDILKAQMSGSEIAVGPNLSNLLWGHCMQTLSDASQFPVCPTVHCHTECPVIGKKNLCHLFCDTRRQTSTYVGILGGIF